MTFSKDKSAQKSALITGVLGQDGYHLSNQLLEKGYDVIGTTRKNLNAVNPSGSESWIKRVTLVQLDLTDEQQILELVKSRELDEIYLLGGVSSVHYSNQFPVETMKVNTLSTLYFLKAVQQSSPNTKVLLASSAEIFGYDNTEKLTETSPLNAASPYGISKLAAHLFVESFRKNYNIFACCGILFNHESSRRGDQFVTKKITQTLVDFAVNGGPKLAIGNLGVCRDWGYAPEYTEGMYLALQSDRARDYIFATGQGESIRTFITESASVLGMELVWEGSELNETATDRISGREVVYVDPKYFRPVDANVMLGNPEFAHNVLGWKAKTNLSGIVKEMIEAELRKVESKRHD